MTEEELAAKKQKSAEEARALRMLLQSPGWPILEAYLRKQIENNSHIKKVDTSEDRNDNSIIRNLVKQKAKVDVYLGIINWLEQQTKEKKDG